jgi:UDP-N-acetylmuramoyl-tripeptide--D-alanyl-D-alanine ligase
MSPLMQLGQVAQWLHIARQVGAIDVAITRVHTDTRSIEPGDLFVALKGERFDANDLLREAQQRGAVAAVCHPGAATGLMDFPCLEVADTKQALAQLATAWRAQFQLPLIAVTGSNGKTTVTQMVAAILDAFQPGGRALATRGNLNNDIGVPLTLLRLRPEHTVAVVELGMNHPGEIAALAAMAQPTVVLVNNAQREHLEFMHTVQAVAQENGSAITVLTSAGTAVFPLDDAYSDLWAHLAGQRVVNHFSMHNTQACVHCVAAQWQAGAWQVRAQLAGQAVEFRLAIAGRHNVKNALAAMACAWSAGVDAQSIVRGLESFVPVKGRSHAQLLQRGEHACTLVDDSYNANPDSVRAAIDVLAELPGPRMLVLGDMGEVGAEGPQLHAEAGRYAHSMHIDYLVATGRLAKCATDAFQGAQHFEDMDELVSQVQKQLPQLASILVKGSRFMRMEQVVEALHAH